ncbi:WD domain, G-beta repeat [Bremerella volcania]|uniref:WD domain, G-beta repeat n=1 Tax=Bremerella volcania TaxID=2527984 RepID=A0A518C907_9BACT|nr:c-type cytochrome domain-containing protein [Bremerella volcania]QDU75713.1 WD domain, G-beta repeat [Bremerella volcania]
MKYTSLLSAFLVLLSCGWQLAAAEAPNYQKDVEPLLRKYCVGCHNDAEPEADLSLQSFKSLQGESSEGPLLKPGDPSASQLVAVMLGSVEPKMPPEDEPQPSKDEINRIVQWIKAGAPHGDSPESSPWKLPVDPIPSSAAVRPVSALAVSPDGKQIAIGRYGQVQFFQLDNGGAYDQGKPALEIAGLPGKVTSLHFARDGKQIAVASGLTGLAGYAAIFTTDTGKEVQNFKGHGDILFDAEISPDGKTIATCGYDRKIVLWDIESGKQLHELTGHNGAVYDVGFSPNSKFLVSGSADDTCKVWRVSDAMRLDTLPQPLKEVYCCAFSPDGKTIVAGGADNNLRVWKFVSQNGPKINPMIQARFAHEGPVQRLAFADDGRKLFTIGNDLAVKLWDTTNYSELKLWSDRPEVAMTAAYAAPSKSLFLGQMNGEVQRITWTDEELNSQQMQRVASIEPKPIPATDMAAIPEAEGNDTPDTAQKVAFPAKIKGTIHNEAEGPDVDFYRFSALAGQTWVLETNAARSKSPLDSHISVYHADGTPVERIKLQAVRDSYFTFRGKDDSTSDDFRIFNWEEMKLNQYLYSSGEVVRLWLHPRGPDSGFKVYPGEGKRWGFFDTTPLAHALGEPCYVVEPVPVGQNIVPNGLPVFTLYYENDDESRRTMGDDSRLFFTAPADGDYLVKVRDVRGFEGDKFTYELSARARQADFRVDNAFRDIAIGAKSYREVRFRCARMDNFDGPIDVRVEGLPEGFTITSPITIEEGQIEAMGVLYAGESAKTLDEEQLKRIKIVASAKIDDKEVTHDVAGFKKIEIRDKTKLAVRIEPAEKGAAPIKKGEDGLLEFEVQAGETIMLKVVADRQGDNGNISFGKEGSGRNLPFAVNVANLGLNGLMIMSGHDEREFFITADEVAQPTSRLFHLQTGSDGGHATQPVLLHVRPN